MHPSGGTQQYPVAKTEKFDCSSLLQNRTLKRIEGERFPVSKSKVNENEKKNIWLSSAGCQSLFRNNIAHGAKRNKKVNED